MHAPHAVRREAAQVAVCPHHKRALALPRGACQGACACACAWGGVELRVRGGAHVVQPEAEAAGEGRGKAAEGEALGVHQPVAALAAHEPLGPDAQQEGEPRRDEAGRAVDHHFHRAVGRQQRRGGDGARQQLRKEVAV